MKPPLTAADERAFMAWFWRAARARHNRALNLPVTTPLPAAFGATREAIDAARDAYRAGMQRGAANEAQRQFARRERNGA